MTQDSGYYTVSKGRAMRRQDHPYRRKPSRRIDWLAVVLFGAAAMVAVTLVYSKVLAP